MGVCRYALVGEHFRGGQHLLQHTSARWASAPGAPGGSAGPLRVISRLQDGADLIDRKIDAAHVADKPGVTQLVRATTTVRGPRLNRGRLEKADLVVVPWRINRPEAAANSRGRRPPAQSAGAVRILDRSDQRVTCSVPGVVTGGANETLGSGGSCLIITGAPAAGKSTVSQLVAERLARSARLNGDFIHRLIVSGFVWGLGQPPEEAALQVQLTRKNLCSLAANFADAGFTPVIDTLIHDREGLDYFLQALSPRHVLFVVLMPSIEVHRYRNTIRAPEEQFCFDDYEALTGGMRRGFRDVGWWFDTSPLTPEQTATQIIANAGTLARTYL